MDLNAVAGAETGRRIHSETRTSGAEVLSHQQLAAAPRRASWLALLQAKASS